MTKHTMVLNINIDDSDRKKYIDSTNENGLLNRIESLPKDEKVRKTIVISRDTGKRLDEFCKVNRLQKSNVLEAAIEDFISKYQ